MDRNMMLQGLQNPCLEVGVISGKGAHDEEKLAEFERNANNGAKAILCYPGGNQPINHDVMPSMTLVGMRNVKLPECDIFEIGMASVAGMCWDDWCSQRQMENDFYWQGIATTEQRRTKPLDSTTDDPPHGYGTLRAGTKSIINNSWKTIYCGDRICWRFPKAPFHPKVGREGSDNRFHGGDPINYLARQGEAPTRFGIEYESYDPCDFAVQMAAAYAALTTTQAQGGIEDMPYQNALPWAAGGPGVKDRPWSALQEEAIAYKFGLWGVALTLIQTLHNAGITVDGKSSMDIAREIGLFASHPPGHANANIVKQGVADVLLDKISPCDPAREAAEDQFLTNHRVQLHEARVFTANKGSEDNALFMANLQAHAIDMLAIGLTSALEEKRSHIVGVAMNSAAPAGEFVLIPHLVMTNIQKFRHDACSVRPLCQLRSKRLGERLKHSFITFLSLLIGLPRVLEFCFGEPDFSFFDCIVFGFESRECPIICVPHFVDTDLTCESDSATALVFDECESFHFCFAHSRHRDTFGDLRYATCFNLQRNNMFLRGIRHLFAKCHRGQAASLFGGVILPSKSLPFLHAIKRHPPDTIASSFVLWVNASR
jgi:hypothetical protein